MQIRYFLYFIISLFFVIAVAAQETNCPAIVEAAFESVEDFCSDLARNSACYGSNRVEAQFYEAVADDYFTRPSDIVSIDELESIRTFPLDEESGLWGVALLQLQANLPNTLPGQNVVFILLGDTELIDDVPLDATVPTIEPITVTVNTGVNLRSGASLRANVIGSVNSDSFVQADGLSADGEWLRVIVDERPAWLASSLVNEDISGLPIVEEIFNAPMQAFHMTTGIGAPDCVEAPDVLLVQGLEEFEIEFQVNGANIRIGSTVLLNMLDEDTMQIRVIDGTAWVNNLRVPAGWKAFVELDPEGGTSAPLDLEGLPEVISEWGTCSPLDKDDLALIESLGNLPVNALNYEWESPQAGFSRCAAPEDLVTTSSSQAASSSTGTCEGFTLIGPFENITPRPTTFEWTAVEGATDYELVFYNYEGNVAGTFFTTETRMNVVLGEVPTGSEMQWEVRAYSNGNYLCVTPRTGVITLLADPLAVAGGGGSSSTSFNATAACLGGGFFTVNYFNAPGGSTQVDMLYNDAVLGAQSHPGGTAPNGTLNNLVALAAPSFQANNIRVVAQPSGTTVSTVPNTLTCP